MPLPRHREVPHNSQQKSHPLGILTNPFLANQGIGLEKCIVQLLPSLNETLQSEKELPETESTKMNYNASELVFSCLGGRPLRGRGS